MTSVEESSDRYCRTLPQSAMYRFAHASPSTRTATGAREWWMVPGHGAPPPSAWTTRGMCVPTMNIPATVTARPIWNNLRRGHGREDASAIATNTTTAGRTWSTISQLEGYADDLGLNGGEFSSCLRSDAHAEVVTANLELARGCRDIRGELQRLATAGDPRVLPAVQRMSDTPHTCGPRNRGDCYACVRRDIEATLEALHAAQAAAEAEAEAEASPEGEGSEPTEE